MPIGQGDIEAAVAGLRADGPHAVTLRFPQKFIGMHLREIAQFLVEWRMPHNIRLLPEQSGELCVLELSFPNERHAYAFEHQFQNDVVKPYKSRMI